MDCELFYLSYIGKHGPADDAERRRQHPRWKELCNSASSSPSAVTVTHFVFCSTCSAKSTACQTHHARPSQRSTTRWATASLVRHGPCLFLLNAI